MNDADLSQSVRIAMMALRDIANNKDCDYLDERDKPTPCPCAKCTARDALTLIESGTKNWRYTGAMSSRLKTNPRERMMIEAWSKSVDDRMLAGILSERGLDAKSCQVLEAPTVRDWYVATSVVQWLATNVGEDVLRCGGYVRKG